MQELSNRYDNELDDHQWATLAKIALLSDKTTVPNNSEVYKLLRSGHLLEYRYYQDQLSTWRDVHPLITMSRRFKEARDSLGGHS